MPDKAQKINDSDKALLIDAARIAYQDFGTSFWEEFAERLRSRLGDENPDESSVVEPAERRTV
jgi:hypothetical protein